MRNPGRDMDKMDASQKLNHTYWELAFAMGWVKPGEQIIDVDLTAILHEATDLIESARNR